jgi:regulator of sigma E protease
MTEIVGSIWWLLVSLGVLVTIHEFGHFWVARRCGVKVLRFSVGFGKPLWLRRGRDGTEYVIAMIPLGGYVRMLGEHDGLEDGRDGTLPPELKAQAHDQQSVYKRMAISLAGPLANLALCVLLLWATFVVGRQDFAPVVGRAQAIAAEAGLERGDEILAVGERATPSLTDANAALLLAALDRQDVTVQLRRADGSSAQATLPLSRLPAKFDERQAASVMGLDWRHELPPAKIGKVNPGPAYGVLAEGDVVTAVDGEPVATWNDIPGLVDQLARRGGPGMVEVSRDGERLAMELTPALIERDGRRFWGLNIAPADLQPPVEDRLVRLGPLEAVPAALREMPYQAGMMVAMVRLAFSGEVEVRNTVSGPVTIARASNYFAQKGVGSYLWLLALLSLSLGILNLLPIPILDGGHLLYYLIELVKGSPVSERVMAAGNVVGLAMIVGLMGLAFYNDIVNNLMP